MSGGHPADEESLHYLALSMLPYPGRRRLRAFIDEEGSAAAGRSKALACLEEAAGRGRLPLAPLPEDTGADGSDRAREALRRAAETDPAELRSSLGERGIVVITPADIEYPDVLRQCSDPPLALFRRGLPLSPGAPRMAIVGSRLCTAYGKRMATEIAERIGEWGVCVVSGGAAGIDAAAHRGALRTAGGTLAVLGCGIDRIYPQENEKLLRHIAVRGSIISEYPPGCEPLRHRFPERNRIIAGLSAGVIVIEAGPQSGALITARLAGEEGRCVMALPGPASSPTSYGCHDLIRDGAVLVCDADQALQECGLAVRLPLPPPEPRRGSAARPAFTACLEKEEQAVLDWLGPDPRPIDEIAAAAGLGPAAACAALTRLELLGLAVSGLDGRFSSAVSAGLQRSSGGS